MKKDQIINLPQQKASLEADPEETASQTLKQLSTLYGLKAVDADAPILEKLPYRVLIKSGLGVWPKNASSKLTLMPQTRLVTLWELHLFETVLKEKLLALISPFDRTFLKALRHYGKLGMPKLAPPKRQPSQFNDQPQKVVYLGQKASPSALQQKFSHQQVKLMMADQPKTLEAELAFWQFLTRLETTKAEKLTAKQRAGAAEIKQRSLMALTKYAGLTRQQSLQLKNKLPALLQIIGAFRDLAESPLGDLLNHQAVDHQEGSQRIDLKGFISLMPYFVPKEKLADFMAEIKAQLLLMVAHGVPMAQVIRLQQHLGLYRGPSVS